MEDWTGRHTGRPHSDRSSKNIELRADDQAVPKTSRTRCASQLGLFE